MYHGKAGTLLMPENVDLNFLAQLCQQTLAEVRSLRKEVGDVRTLALQNVDYTRRLERRMHESSDDLELMLKAEIGGSFSQFEVRVERTLAPLVSRIEALEQR
ncbi:MAG: hypothetical protein ACRED5_02195 [Propylenella sp.]